MRSFVATIRFPKMFAPSISRRVCPNAQRAGECFTDHRLVRLSFGGGRSPITNDSIRSGFTQQIQRERASAFTLLELLIVVGIIGLLMVLIAPAFTSIKGGTDVTSAAYTIKGVLDTARTYAKANNTYTWVGFFEEDASQPSTIPATAGNGRIVMSIVASKDGTTVYNPNSITNPDPIDPTKLTQVGKLVKIDNLHLPLFAIGSGTGDTFDTRPALQNDPVAVYNYSRFGEINAAVPNTAPYD